MCVCVCAGGKGGGRELPDAAVFEANACLILSGSGTGNEDSYCSQ